MIYKEFKNPLEEFARKLRESSEEIPPEVREIYENNKEVLYE